MDTNGVKQLAYDGANEYQVIQLGIVRKHTLRDSKHANLWETSSHAHNFELVEDLAFLYHGNPHSSCRDALPNMRS